MNDSIEDYTINALGGFMKLGNAEKSELIFSEVKNSYLFWQIKKAIKDELVK